MQLPHSTFSHRLASLKNNLLEHSHRLHTTLITRDETFEGVPVELMQDVCVDESLRSTLAEEKAPIMDNSRAAYVGDAFLTLFVAKRSFEANKSPKDHQSDRSKYTQKSSLTRFYDKEFGADTPLPLTILLITKPGTPPTADQKRVFVEALIGVLYQNNFIEQAEKICSWIIELHAAPKE